MAEINSERPIRKELPKKEFNLYEILFKYLAYWPWFVVSLVICIFCAHMYLRYSTPIYSSTAKILIKEQNSYNGKSITPNSDVMELADMNFTSLFDNELELIKSRILIKQAVSDLGLYITHSERCKFGYDQQYYKNSPVQVYMTAEDADKLLGDVSLLMSYNGKELTANISYTSPSREHITLEKQFTELPAALSTDVGVITFTPSASYRTEEPIELLVYISNPKTTAGRYRGRLSVSPMSKTTTIANITINDAVPARASDLITQLVKVYNDDANNEKNEVAQKTAEFIEERIAIINSELGSTENELATFKQRSGLTDLTSNAQLALQEKSRYDQQLAENATQINLVQEVQKYLIDEANVNEIIPANIGLEDEHLMNLINQYNTYVIERKRLLRTSSENNPAVINMNSSIEVMRSNVQASIESVLHGLQITKNSLQREANKFKGRISDAPTQEKEFMTIQRQQEIKATLYTLLLKKREENALTLAATASKGRIIEAPISGGPISPQRQTILLAALILGLGIPVGVIILKEMLKYKIENRMDIEKITLVPIVGEIPSCNQSLKGQANNIIIRENKNDMMEETFRAIRTNLIYMLEKGEKVILITSSIPQEGKSFVAANLAVSMAFLGKKTLIVGMDIRKPGLNKTFGFSTRSHGITNYLRDPEGVNLYEIIMESEISPNLHILPGGSVPPNPTELVARPIFEEIILKLKEHYDYIILDTAPIGLVTDTSIIAHVADIGVIVCRADYTPKAAYQNINSLEQDKIFKKMATLVNDIDMSLRKNSYSYSYGRKYGYGYARKYGFGYGYGYGYENENKKS